MEGSTMPSTVEEVFEDYQGRRAGLIKALIVEKENLCLYAYPKGTWEVTLPAEEVPPELPEPALGINFARDGMESRDWLSLIAVHSDSWLYAVAFYYCARFNKQERKRLFGMINELPTVYEVVSGRRSAKEKAPSNNGSHKAKTTSKKEKLPKQSSLPEEEDENYEDEYEESDTFCGICGGLYSGSEFWIACDICERWFHGKCVKVTAARAEHIKQYKCPPCTSKKRTHP
ncbi:hypothetical protein KP509_01G011000 [Ceratopteris richardii]|uniref:PHD-type domain-containing protein n=1 Tax=Ceratopteris richardii TaxID=49495 RepID=A0A8T2VEF7_CERRI|nr:hypothetical protein KP509_01G011000 [Ceratopteris richardii]KAH7445479.1 hypothetical protein KP509_01G011000 [Ceratopteris richardii]